MHNVEHANKLRRELEYQKQQKIITGLLVVALAVFVALVGAYAGYQF